MSFRGPAYAVAVTHATLTCNPVGPPGKNPQEDFVVITIEVKFLGPSKDLAGTRSASLELVDNAQLDELRAALTARFPKIAAALPTVRFAVNQEFVVGDLALKDGDEVAVIPPVSGGEGSERTWVALVDEPIPVARVRGFVTGDPSLGAITTFEGATRNDSHELHGPVVRLEYEAYRQMAVKQMERLVNEALNRWSLGRVVMIHRLGSVGSGEISIMIAVAGGHREESFVACRWLIDTLKKDVPIWKKDIYADGTGDWVTPEGISPELSEHDE